MSRSWYLRGFLFLALIVGSVLVLVQSLFDQVGSSTYRGTARMPALCLAIVDDDSEFMCKLVASLPDGGAIEVATEKHGAEDGGIPCPHLRAP